VDDAALLGIVRLSPRASERRAGACDLLVSRHQRPVQELVLELREATWRLAQELGRTPAESDLTRHLGVSRDDLWQAQRAEIAYQTYSLDAPPAGQPRMGTLADVLGAEDPRLEHMLGMQAIATHWGELPPREQEILLMRYRGGMTQAQIGQRLRISQMLQATPGRCAARRTWPRRAPPPPLAAALPTSRRWRTAGR
jgi:DNA-directed RNA polymerase specialized sigma24 family protein